MISNASVVARLPRSQEAEGGGVIHVAITCTAGCQQHARLIGAQLAQYDEQNLRIVAERADAGCISPDVWLWIVGRSGLDDARRRAAESGPAAGAEPVIAITDDLEAADIDALLAAGVSDFSALPFDVAECAARIRRVSRRPPPLGPADVREVLSPATKDIVGTSPNFVRQLSCLPTIAGCNAGVLILGETGTGKEVFAEAIHYLSSRASKPWVAVNCGGIPSELIESELFGHVKGAFTNAVQSRTGLVQEAEGGTLFLDEIDSLPYSSQSKLIRFLQDKTYRPVGTTKQAVADVRVLAASNQDLSRQVADGRFRRDLYFRLNVLSITLPALRDRREDIPALAQHFVRKACEAARRPVLGISPALLAEWLAHDWPGNVRELRHAVERAVLFAQAGASFLRPADESASAGSRVSLDSSFQSAKARVVSHFERSYLESVLRSSGGNITRAAELAGKNRRAFFELLRKHRIRARSFRPAELTSPEAAG